MIREDPELLGELVRLNRDMAFLGMCIMDGASPLLNSRTMPSGCLPLESGYGTGPVRRLERPLIVKFLQQDCLLLQKIP